MACASVFFGIWGAGEARAGAPVLGTAEPRYLSAETDKERRFLLKETRKAGAGIVRMNAFWFMIAPGKPADGRDPRDPAYKWGPLDAAVRAADKNDLDIFLTLQRAPRWAENGSDGQDRGVFRPDVGAFADYTSAVTRRYLGDFPDPANPGETLPRVRHYQLWNEANLNKFYAPQLRKGKSVSADNYRKLLNKAYKRVKAEDPANKVVVAGSGPRGPTEKARTAPKEWWKDLLCLGKANRRGCKPAKFDIFDHHPITVKYEPTRKGRNGEILIADYHKLTKLLRKAERKNTVGGPKRHDQWATEIYWETDPPETKRGFPELKAARYLEEGIYLLARQQVDVILNFFMIDAPLTVPGDVANIQGGLLNKKGKRKDSFTAFKFPFVTDRISKRKVRAWGIAPEAGRVVIQRKSGKGGYRTVARIRTGERKVFSRNLKARGRAKFRASVGGERSLVWKQGAR